MQDYRQLRVWQRAHRLVLDVYRATATFPAEEKYGLTSQLRRSAVSVPSNIAEGCGRSSNADFARFLHIPTGSVLEADYQLLLARDLGYLHAAEHEPLAAEATAVRRMLLTLQKRVTQNS